MLNQEESANIVQLLEDLQTDLKNGNVPASKLLIVSIVNCLLLKLPLEWKMLGDLVIEHLEEYETRIALLHLLPKLKEMICPFQPDQVASKEC